MIKLKILMKITNIDINGRWIEIDTPEDLERATNLITVT